MGYSHQAQKFHADRGNWQKIDRGLYRVPEWPVGQHDDLVRWSLWSRSRAVVSHETALAVHDLGDVDPSIAHLTVPPSFRSKPPSGVRLHRGELPDSDVWGYEGFRVTSPLRALLDVSAGTLDLDQLVEVIRQACELQPSTRDGLLSRAEEMGPRVALRTERALRLGGLL